MFYYSLKTKKEEHCLEKRIGGDYDYAIYDLEQNLKGKKTLVKKSDVVEFLWNKQKELKAVFEKVSLEDKKDAVLIKSIEEQLDEKIQDGRIIFSEVIEGVTSDGVRFEKSIDILEAEKGTSNPDVYKISSEVNLKTGVVNIVVDATPVGNPIVSASHLNKIISKLFYALVASLPELADQHVIAAGVLACKQDTSSFKKAYEKEVTNKLFVRTSILNTIKSALETYKIK